MEWMAWRGRRPKKFGIEPPRAPVCLTYRSRARRHALRWGCRIIRHPLQTGAQRSDRFDDVRIVIRHCYSVLTELTGSLADSDLVALSEVDSAAGFDALSESDLPAGTAELPVFLLSLM